jgi:hypothetical protein
MNRLEKLSENAPDLSFELPDGTSVVRLGLIVTLYFKDGYTLQCKQAVMQCFARFKEEFGQHLKGQFDHRYKKLTDASLDKKLPKFSRRPQTNNTSGISAVPLQPMRPANIVYLR